MNLDDKLKMAHEYAKIMLSSGLKGDFDFIDFKDLRLMRLHWLTKWKSNTISVKKRDYLML